MPPKLPKGEVSQQTREEFLDSKPYSLTITLDPRQNRGGDLPDEFSLTTQVYPYLTYEELYTAQKAVADALFGLGLKRIEAERADTQ